MKSVSLDFWKEFISRHNKKLLDSCNVIKFLEYVIETLEKETNYSEKLKKLLCI